MEQQSTRSSPTVHPHIVHQERHHQAKGISGALLEHPKETKLGQAIAGMTSSPRLYVHVPRADGRMNYDRPKSASASRFCCIT